MVYVEFGAHISATLNSAAAFRRRQSPARWNTALIMYSANLFSVRLHSRCGLHVLASSGTVFRSFEELKAFAF